MKLRKYRPRFPLVAHAIYPDKTLTKELHGISDAKEFIGKHEAQGAHWVVLTWEDRAETEGPWVITLEKRLSIGFTDNMQKDDLAEKEVYRG
jgi:hypothetical protein